MSFIKKFVIENKLEFTLYKEILLVEKLKFYYLKRN